MAKDLKNGQMVLNIKDSGVKIKLMDLANLYMLMVTFMKGSG